jgi:hypothetical protein
MPQGASKKAMQEWPLDLDDESFQLAGADQVAEPQKSTNPSSEALSSRLLVAL